MVRMDASPELTSIVASGEPTTLEFLNVYWRFLDAPSPDSLWDLSSARINGISSPDLQELARDFRRAALGRRRPGRTAAVCGQLVDYGLARMFATLASDEEHGVELGVFHGLDEAKAWLATGRQKDAEGKADTSSTPRGPFQVATQLRQPTHLAPATDEDVSDEERPDFHPIGALPAGRQGR